jgi:hypothetical protein
VANQFLCISAVLVDAAMSKNAAGCSRNLSRILFTALPTLALASRSFIHTEVGEVKEDVICCQARSSSLVQSNFKTRKDRIRTEDEHDLRNASATSLHGAVNITATNVKPALEADGIGLSDKTNVETHSSTSSDTVGANVSAGAHELALRNASTPMLHVPDNMTAANSNPALKADGIGLSHKMNVDANSSNSSNTLSANTSAGMHELAEVSNESERLSIISEKIDSVAQQNLSNQSDKLSIISENMDSVAQQNLSNQSDTLSIISENSDAVAQQNLTQTLEEQSVIFIGKPRKLSTVLQVFFVMLLPVCICGVVCSINLLIRLFSEEAWSRNGTARLILGQWIYSGGSGDDGPLCEELKAPENECVIALPSILDLSTEESVSERMIVSQTGLPVAKVFLARVHDTVLEGMTNVAAHDDIIERISIVSDKCRVPGTSSTNAASGSLGFCELRLPRSGSIVGVLRPLKCFIYQKNGHHFATLEEDLSGKKLGSSLSTRSILPASSSGYYVTLTASGKCFWIAGDFDNYKVLVMQGDGQDAIIEVEQGESLAFKKAENNYYSVRIQPNVDAGVIVLALLAIDRFRSSRFKLG